MSKKETRAVLDRETAIKNLAIAEGDFLTVCGWKLSEVNGNFRWRREEDGQQRHISQERAVQLARGELSYEELMLEGETAIDHFAAGKADD